MKVEIDSEVIAEVRNALTIIWGNAELIKPKCHRIKREKIIKQVKRIDNLLPPVKFEG